jgi:ribosome biogenesis GTPase
MYNVPQDDFDESDRRGATARNTDRVTKMNNLNTFQLVEGMGWQSYFAEQLDEDETQTRTPVPAFPEVRSNGLHVVGQDMDQMIPPSSLGKRRRVVVGWLLLDAHQRISRVFQPQRVSSNVVHRICGGKTQLIVAIWILSSSVSSCNQDFNVARLERYVAMASKPMSHRSLF